MRLTVLDLVESGSVKVAELECTSGCIRCGITDKAMETAYKLED